MLKKEAKEITGAGLGSRCPSIVSRYRNSSCENLQAASDKQQASSAKDLESGLNMAIVMV